MNEGFYNSFQFNHTGKMKQHISTQLNRRKFVGGLAGIVALASLNTLPSMAAVKPKPPAGKRMYTDAHCHLVDFLQESQGLEALLKAADQAGVEHIQIMGLPVIKKWNARDRHKPAYYLGNTNRCYYFNQTDSIVARQYSALAKEDQSRVHPFLCGFNPTDRNCIDHVHRMFDWYPEVWEGIGELLLHRAQLSMLTNGEQARANHPALQDVYNFAAERNIPVQIHSDMGVASNQEPIYLYEMEEAVRNAPNTRFIWCHAGYNRGLNIPTAPAEIHRMIRTYPNLWVDISWLVFENWIFPKNRINSVWLEIFKEYPDRFFIGSDKIGRFDTYPEAILKYDKLMNLLSENDADMIARTNFLTMLKG